MPNVPAFRIPFSWVHGGVTFELRLFSNVTWTDLDGDIHLAGDPGPGQPCQVCPGTIAGTQATVTSFALAATVKENGQSASPDRNTPRLTGVLFDSHGRMRETLFENFQVPSVEPLIWTVWSVYNRSRIMRLAAKYVTREDILTLLAQFIGTTLPASDVVLGSVLLDESPVDPASPLTIRLQASGRDDLVGGEVTTIPTDLVLEDSPILALPADSGITGRLYATNIIPGVSFDVASENGADAGEFKWYLL